VASDLPGRIWLGKRAPLIRWRKRAEAFSDDLRGSAVEESRQVFLDGWRSSISVERVDSAESSQMEDGGESVRGQESGGS
jgi:hypothetical protein